MVVLLVCAVCAHVPWSFPADYIQSRFCAFNITANAAACPQEGRTALMMAVRGLEHDKIVQMLFSKTTSDPDIKDKVRLWGAEAHFLFGNMLGREKRREEDKVASVSPVVRDFDASPCHVRTAVVVELQPTAP